MKKKIIITLLVLLCYPTICCSQNELESEIMMLLKSTKVADQYEAVDLMQKIEIPSKTLINAVFASITHPPFISLVMAKSDDLIVKWGVYTSPFLIEALKDASNRMHHRVPRLLLQIAQKHNAELIAPAVPYLVDYIKKNKREKNYALLALGELGELASSIVPFLTEKMNTSKDTIFHLDFLIARVLKKIAGPEYPPIKSVLAEEKEFRRQDTTVVNHETFQLKVGFDVSKVKFKEEKSEHQLSISIGNSEFYPYKIIKYGGVIYNIAIKDDRIIYISTHDNKFIANDSLMMGDDLKKAKTLGYTEFVKARAENYIVELESGWSAVFYTDTPLNDNSKIVWFFKR